jgi:hypothetical protein
MRMNEKTINASVIFDLAKQINYEKYYFIHQFRMFKLESEYMNTNNDDDDDNNNFMQKEKKENNILFW